MIKISQEDFQLSHETLLGLTHKQNFQNTGNFKLPLYNEFLGTVAQVKFQSITNKLLSILLSVQPYVASCWRLGDFTAVHI